MPPLQDGLFPDEQYNGQPIPEDRKGYVMTYNRIVGKIRMRQLRVAPDTRCTLQAGVSQTGLLLDGSTRRRQFIEHCYAAYSKPPLGSASNASFGKDPALQVKFTGGFAWSNATENKLGTRTTIGQIGSYDGSGFVRDLISTSRDEYVRAVDELKDNLWVDEQTRAVIITLNLYNGNYNYYCISQYVIEFSDGGALIATATNKASCHQQGD